MKRFSISNLRLVPWWGIHPLIDQLIIEKQKYLEFPLAASSSCWCATSKSVYLQHCLAEQVWIGVQIGGLAHCRFCIIFRSQQARTVS
jgi:hypothetical protein